MSRPTLVTGAAGFAGSHLVDLLRSQGAEVIAWHHAGKPAPASVPGITWRGVDMLDQRSVTASVEDTRPQRVFHCAGAAHVGQAWDRTTDALAINVLGTHHLLEALRRAVPDARVLVTSSALVYAPSENAMDEQQPLRPANPYGLSKLAQEMIGLGTTSGPSVWIARPFNHFGPRQGSTFVTSAFARQIAEIEAGRQAPEMAVGNLEPRRDLTDVRDTVRAYTRILDDGHADRPYNVCSGRAVSVQYILDTLLAMARVPIRVAIDRERYRPNDTPMVLGSAGRLQGELGWEPVITLEQTLHDLLEYWRDRATGP